MHPGMVLNIIGYDARLLLLSLCLATTVKSFYNKLVNQ